MTGPRLGMMVVLGTRSNGAMATRPRLEATEVPTIRFAGGMGTQPLLAATVRSLTHGAKRFMDPQILKVVGVAFNAVGALILAIRVKKILDAVAASLHCHEANIQQLMKEITGKNLENICNFTNSPAQVDKAQKIGVKLLVIAFTMLFIGNALIGLSVLLDWK